MAAEWVASMAADLVAMAADLADSRRFAGSTWFRRAATVRRGVFIGGLGFGYYGYPYGWDYSPTMAILATANPTPRRTGTTVRIL
jgi:hypothetical protein